MFPFDICGGRPGWVEKRRSKGAMREVNQRGSGGWFWRRKNGDRCTWGDRMEEDISNGCGWWCASCCGAVCGVRWKDVGRVVRDMA